MPERDLPHEGLAGQVLAPQRAKLLHVVADQRLRAQYCPTSSVSTRACCAPAWSSAERTDAVQSADGRPTARRIRG
jgi:hypothetical protein